MKNRLSNRVGIIVGCILIMIWCLLPVAWIISLSFKSETAITNGSPGFFPSDGGERAGTTIGRSGTTTSSAARSSTRSASA